MDYEVEFAPGLEPIVRQEIIEIIAESGRVHKQQRAGELRFSYKGDDVRNLLNLRCVIAVYAVQRFAVPRPKALLGHQNFMTLVNAIRDSMNIIGQGHYQTLYIGAAGSDSSVMVRLKEELAQELGLQVADDAGDLYLRLHPTYKDKGSWDALIRITPRPLASRDWRVCNMEGALNASVAHAMIRMSNPRSTDTFLNIACGSGTIMIERQAMCDAEIMVGCDINEQALQCATMNFAANQTTEQLQLLHCDGCALPLSTGSVDALCADLPFGQLVGSHDENMWLYPAILAEAGRVAKPGAQFVIITHEVNLMEDVLKQSSEWRVNDILRITLSGLHPRIYQLERQ